VIPRRNPKPWRDKAYVKAYKASPHWESLQELNLGSDSPVKRVKTGAYSAKANIKDDVHRAKHQPNTEYGLGPDGRREF
jgi:hypothetical protein